MTMELITIAVAVCILALLIVLLTIYMKKKNETKREAWEESIQKQVMQDLQSNKKRYNLWKLAMKESDGVEERCQSLYVKYCVQSIIGEHEILNTVRL